MSTVIYRCFFIAIFLGLFSSTSTLFAKERIKLTKLKKCNESFTKCIIDSKRLTIGDKVGLFAEDGRLVAEARVKSIKNGWRYINITKSYGKQSRVSYVDLWRNKSDYQTYLEAANFSIGFDLNFAKYENESLMSLLQLGIFAEWKNEFLGLGLGDYFGVVTRFNFYTGGDTFDVNLNDGIVPYDYKTTVAGVLAGFSFNTFKSSKVSPRFEVTGGYGFGSESLETQDTFQAPDLDIRINDGGNLLFMAQGALVFNFGKFHPNIGGSASLVGRSWGRAMHVGLIYDL